jgi:chromosome segregation protein
MKLKSISIFGFKSFADRITVHYHDGITGVIGPNGSGKSNIIDAVRWVMGEQTAKNLRADDPKDIIFAGSQNRKALSMAEVTLTFSNTGKGCPPEFLHLPEVSIGRRIYRSGEREYIMNRQACRLKDIVDFLLQIGLGSKSYSIIQQDRRDRIIHATPSDLREILEETAGISIFKQHRKDAEKRLESTADRLKSLAEIESELSKQSESLREQVEKAAMKMKLVKELRLSEIELIANHVGYYRAIATRIRKDISTRADEAEKSSVEHSSYEVRANDLKTSQIEFFSKIRELENEFDERKIALTKYVEREENMRRRMDERTQQKANLSRELADERANLEREEEKLSSYLASLEETERNLRNIDGELESLSDRLEEVDEGMQVERIRGEELRSEIRAIEDLLSTLRTRNEGILQAIQKTNASLARAEDLLREAESTKTRIIADRRELEGNLHSISEGVESVAHERSRLDSELHEIDERLRTAREARDIAKERYLELSGMASSVQKLIAANEGLSDGARALRERLNTHILGFVFEKLSVHVEDELILEKGLSHYLQAALVRDFESLVDILDKVEEMGLTRVAFLVQDALQPLSAAERDLKQRMLSISGVRCVGDRVEKPGNTDLSSLLERVFIARDEWLAYKALRECPAEFRDSFLFISERGVLLTGLRQITFGDGNAGEGTGLLQRKRELAELLEQKRSIESSLASAEGSLVKMQESRKEREVRLAEIDTRLSRERLEVLKLTAQLEGFDLQLKHADENIARLSEDKNVLFTEIDSAKNNFSKNQTQIEKSEEERRLFLRDLEDFQESFDEKKELRETIATQILNKKAERGVIFERQSSFRRNYEELRMHLTRSQQKVDRIIRELGDLDSNMSLGTDEVSALRREIERLRSEVTRIDAELTVAQSEEAQVSEELRVIENRLKSEKDVQAQRQKFINEKRLELQRCDLAIESFEKDALERFQLKPEDLPPEAPDDQVLRKQLESQIKTLQTQVGELGPVNELAVEEYTAVEERRNFLIEQKADIERSVIELQTAIAEIESTIQSRFLEIYNVVNTEFQSLFPILFPGGNAGLHLLNPEELLSTGVEILVQLPGKKQQNMSLFSGGEKALTAISLIFAILKTKPTPFCFLDEVDAPLDEANVGRFNAVLEALCDIFQFVVITHNRRTMEVLDTIYGISMPEPGVSRIVSVDLTEVPGHLQKKKRERQMERPGATIS